MADDTVWQCRFVIEHEVELGVILECAFDSMFPFWQRTVAFRGKTVIEGAGEFTVLSNRKMHFRSSTTGTARTSTVIFDLDEVILERVDKPESRQARYGIANFTFYPTEFRPVQGSELTEKLLSLELSTEKGNLNVELSHIDNYVNISDYVSRYRAIRVTSEALVRLGPGETSETTDGVIGGLCSVMSIARGTRIVWLYRREFDTQARLCVVRHHSAWVGKHSNLSVFDDRPAHRFEVKRFLEKAFPIFQRQRDAFELGNNLIESYLSAKAEGDLLERRGVKIAVSLELLKHLYLTQKDCPIKKYLISGSKFKKVAGNLKAAIREELETQDLTDELISDMCEKINELNRTTFKVILRSTFKSFGFEPSEAEINLFIKQRNSLIHTGHFYEFKPEDRDIVYFMGDSTESSELTENPYDTIVPSYYFMVNFMDRLFLKFFDYDGAYINTKVNYSEGSIDNYGNV